VGGDPGEVHAAVVLDHKDRHLYPHITAARPVLETIDTARSFVVVDASIARIHRRP
jgi:hypothetical protein